MVILILIDVLYLQNVAFTIEKVQMVKFTLPQIPTTQKKPKKKTSEISHPLPPPTP